MLVLDTDHFSELERDLEPGKRLTERLNLSVIDKAPTVITSEEETRGWLAEINRRRILTARLPPWDADSADLFLGFGGRARALVRWI